MKYRATRLIIRPDGDVPAGAEMPVLSDTERDTLQALGAIAPVAEAAAAETAVADRILAARRRRGAAA